MLNKVLQNKKHIFFTVVLVSLLMLVRAFEQQLFYDPFLVYFNGDYLKLPLPEFNSGLLFLGLLLRFSLNTVLSLGILYLLFKDREMILFAAVLYALLFVILIIAFFSIVFFFKNEENLILFYVRRFLIQPLFVIVFIPAFYFQKLNKY
ncbi:MULTISPECIES: exosortase F system-associated membrane protein [Flavobacterium]|uniref:exosortase F system-associated membrane protein n=1 Tax=Flavobacterium TaxID=237 RepID=UPI00188AB28C|nr:MULTISPECIES: exosortase F system-associated protein [Flavobacterium]MBF4472002.1 exosortase F system-associated protein [Flavobacterium sp. HJJ]